MTTVVLAVTSTEKALIQEEQTQASKYTGSYQPVYDKPIQVFTYETICKGYYTVEKTADSIIYTGYGDLKDQYTHTEKLPQTKVEALVATTTNPIDEKTIDPVDTTSADFAPVGI